MILTNIEKKKKKKNQTNWEVLAAQVSWTHRWSGDIESLSSPKNPAVPISTKAMLILKTLFSCSLFRNRLNLLQ